MARNVDELRALGVALGRHRLKHSENARDPDLHTRHANLPQSVNGRAAPVGLESVPAVRGLAGHVAGAGARWDHQL